MQVGTEHSEDKYVYSFDDNDNLILKDGKNEVIYSKKFIIKWFEEHELNILCTYSKMAIYIYTHEYIDEKW